MLKIKVKALTNSNYSANGVDVAQLEPGEELELPAHIAESLVKQKAVELIVPASQEKAPVKQGKLLRTKAKPGKGFGDDLFGDNAKTQSR